MKDYTETDYQKKSFIVRYIINVDTNEIEIIYADNEVQTIPYTIHNELVILEKMKKQIKYYPNFIDNAKLDRKFLRLKKYMCLSGAGLGTIVLTHLGALTLSLGIVGVAIIPSLAINTLMILVLKKYYDQADDQIISINESINDYYKNIFFIKNEEFFTNEKILEDEVILESPVSVQATIIERKLYDLPEEVPSINMNSLENISLKDLKETYELSKNNNPKLVLKPMNSKK